MTFRGLKGRGHKFAALASLGKKAASQSRPESPPSGEKGMTDMKAKKASFSQETPGTGAKRRITHPAFVATSSRLEEAR